MEFTDKEIKEELAKLGYENVSEDILKNFKEDLTEYWKQSTNNAKTAAPCDCCESEKEMDRHCNKANNSKKSSLVNELSNTSVEKTQSQTKKLSIKSQTSIKASKSVSRVISSDDQSSASKKPSKTDQKAPSRKFSKSDQKALSKKPSKEDQKSVSRKNSKEDQKSVSRKPSKDDQKAQSRKSSKEDEKSVGKKPSKEDQKSESGRETRKSSKEQTESERMESSRPVTWKKSEDDHNPGSGKQTQYDGNGVQASWSEIERKGEVTKDSKRNLALASDCPFGCGGGMFNAEDLATPEGFKEGLIDFQSTFNEPKKEEKECKPSSSCTRSSKCKTKPMPCKKHQLSTMNSKASVKHEHLTCFKERSAHLRTLESYNPDFAMESSICKSDYVNADWDFDETDTEEVFNRYSADLRKRLDGEKESSCGYPKKKKIKKVKTKKEPYTSVIVKLKAKYYKKLKHDGYVASHYRYQNIWQRQPVDHLHSKPRYSIMRAVHERIKRERERVDQEKKDKAATVYIYNEYETPASKKRQALRWQVRSALETYNYPKVGLYHPVEPLAH